MNDALYIAAAGMQAQQTNVETIANNLVNANTPGFKRGKVSFTDMVVAQAGNAGRVGASSGANNPIGAEAMVGTGVVVAGVGRQFDFGELKKTDSQYDIAIQGDGFLEVTMPDGSRAFTRGGTLKVNRDGQLATQSGMPLKPGISIPENTQTLTISPSGAVQARVAGQQNPVDLGQLELVRFPNTDQLAALGDDLYKMTQGSGDPIAGDGVGTIAQGYLEGSNVKMVDEMTNLLMAQRAYEMSVKVIQASDEMLAAANNLRK